MEEASWTVQDFPTVLILVMDAFLCGCLIQSIFYVATCSCLMWFRFQAAAVCGFWIFVGWERMVSKQIRIFPRFWRFVLIWRTWFRAKGDVKILEKIRERSWRIPYWFWPLSFFCFYWNSLLCRSQFKFCQIGKNIRNIRFIVIHKFLLVDSVYRNSSIVRRPFQPKFSLL